MSEKTGGPAFPGQKDIRFGQPNDCNEGMLLRDYFAAAALQGILASAQSDEIPIGKVVAKNVYDIADAMLEERNK